MCVAAMRDRLPADTFICNGAGNFSGWWHRYWRYGGPVCQLAPTAGAMGYGLPAAVAAALRYPDRKVVALAGDGDFMMNGQELATAMQYGADMLVIVVDNGAYGTIRMHQEREYPARVSGTALSNPDFAALARAYGGWAETVEATKDFAPALDRALKLFWCDPNRLDFIAERALDVTGNLLGLALQFLCGTLGFGFRIARMLLGLADCFVDSAFDLVGEFTHRQSPLIEMG
jgi:TPP-dependent 2-oxoacid decarboxylase